MHPKRVILKPGKEKPVLHHHHWIFSGAVSSLPDFNDGDCLQVYSHAGEHLGVGYFNRKAKIIGRMLSFDGASPEDAIKTHLHKAVELRRILFEGSKTNAYRLVNGEGDLLPGLIVDRYGDMLVLQISTLGMLRQRPTIVEWLTTHLKPSGIYEKSLLPSRREEGLTDEKGILQGREPQPEMQIRENGLGFFVDIVHGQKTGFFLDHREMRQQVKELAKERRVLNCFAYTGGFSIYAAAGGAAVVDSVDISEAAMQMAQRNFKLNGFSTFPSQFFNADVFKFLRENPLNYHLVILDPPAFAKRQKDVVQACRGYKDINRLAFQKMPKSSFLLTSSCSYHVDEALFQKVVFQAALEAKRNVKILGRHRLAADHPINICHPEGDYLKSLLLYID